MLTSNIQLGYLLTRGWGQTVQGGLSCPPARISKRMDNPQIFVQHLLQEYLVERGTNFISVSEILTSNIQWGYILTRGGGQAVQGSLSWPPPPPRISERMDNRQILLHHLLQEYLVEKGINFISVSEMLTSKVQFGYVLTRGGGQAVQGGLSCPPPRISERVNNLQILLHHLQEYLVERDINFISVNLRCLLQMFSWVTYWQGMGGKLSRAV